MEKNQTGDIVKESSLLLWGNIFPKHLVPKDKALYEVNGEKIEIPKCIISFEEWTGQRMKNDFNGKGQLCVNNKPMFAEFAIRECFITDGWEARWINTFAVSKYSPNFLDEWKDDGKWQSHQKNSPIADEKIKNLLYDIVKYNSNSYAGCWDVFGWKDGRVLFAESKRKNKDRIQPTQLNWLVAAFKCGLKPDNFLIVEWDYC